MKSGWENFRSWVALIVSLISLSFAFLQSPLSPFFKPLLHYRQHRSNYNKEFGNPHNAVAIVNMSTTTPAKNVTVLIQTGDKELTIESDAVHTVTNTGFNYVVQFPSIPPDTVIGLEARTSTTNAGLPVVVDVYAETGHAVEDNGSLDGPEVPPFNRFVQRY